MRIYLGFDDTDVAGAAIGTGKLVRMFAGKLPVGVRLWGVLRHQLLMDPRIPYTSHNSPACAVVDTDLPDAAPILIELAIAHLAELASPGSDPGLCVARADASLDEIVEFGLCCTRSVRTQSEAKNAAAVARVHLSGHGGTNDGIIGAAAAVGLSHYGWSGRFLEFNGLRNFPDPVSVGELRAGGIVAVPLDRNAEVLPPELPILTKGWLRPRLWGGRPVLPVQWEDGHWVALGRKPKDADVAE
jgi:hypothetical protein